MACFSLKFQKHDEQQEQYYISSFGWVLKSQHVVLSHDSTKEASGNKEKEKRKEKKEIINSLNTSFLLMRIEYSFIGRVSESSGFGQVSTIDFFSTFCDVFLGEKTWTRIFIRK